MGQNVTIAATPPAAMIVQGDDNDPTSGLILNQSATNILYIGNNTSVDPNDPLNNTPVPPGQYVPFDGTESIYAIAASGQTIPVSIMYGISGAPFNQNIEITGPTTVVISGTVQVNVANTPNVNVANTPNVNVGTVSGSINVAAVAGNVDIIGVGGFISSGQFAQLVNDTTTHAIVGTASFTTAVQNLSTYSSFALNVQGYNSGMGAAGSALVARVTLNFYADAAASLLLYRKTYWMWLASSPANAPLVPLKVTGPLYGGFMTVEIDNFSGSGTTNVNNIQLYGTGRPLAKMEARQASPLLAGISSNGITLLPSADWTSYNSDPALLQGDDNILALETNDTAIPINSTFWMPFPLHCGKVSINYQVANALSHAFVICSAAGLTSGLVVAGTTSQGLLWSVGTGVLSAQINDLAVGDAPIYAVIASGAAVPNLDLAITGE